MKKTDISDVRALFDNVIEKYANLETHLGADADIVHSPHFDSAIIKLHDKKFETLTDDEEAAILCLKMQQTTSATAEAGDALDSPGSVENLLKKRKLEKLSCQAKCVFQDSRYLLATSNIIEWFFSTAGHAFSDHRQGLRPMNLEMHFFVKINKKFWDAETVTQLLIVNN